MTTFLRLLGESDKAAALGQCCAQVRAGAAESRCIEVSQKAFDVLPGKPFAYWVSEEIRRSFKAHSAFEGNGRAVRQGLATADDFRFLRVSWEVLGAEAKEPKEDKWFPFAKGGSYSPYYTDFYMSVNWHDDGREMKAWADPLYGNSGWSRIIKSTDFYFKPGITWPLRAHRFSPQVLPKGCVFSVRGYCAFPEKDAEAMTLAVFNSAAFDYLYKTVLGRFGFPEFIVGILQIMPWADCKPEQAEALGALAQRAWLLRRTLDTINENSHAFLLPATLRTRLGGYDMVAIQQELASIQTEIDDIAFELYGFADADRTAALGGISTEAATDEVFDDEVGDDDDSMGDAPSSDALLSWVVGVAFGRFDWRLATGERAAPPEPEPFDQLPVKSPGMLPDGATPFHQHAGILVDDMGHPHDLPRLVERVLEAVEASVAEKVRRWLQKDFFSFHLTRYSKSRRKAPIYWPLSTASGSYTLWLYYPSLNDQTLFSGVNDFVDPKLEDVRKELQTLRDKGAGRNKQDEKSLEALVSLEHELADLRDSLLEIAPNYRPSHDDGVQITAAPLWKLFRHKPWQKVLKDTWAKLEKGDYDWAHLAMNYWPDRVRDKCVIDKSLAIAHGLEHLYVETEPVEKKTRGRKKAGSTE